MTLPRRAGYWFASVASAIAVMAAGITQLPAPAFADDAPAPVSARTDQRRPAAPVPLPAFFEVNRGQAPAGWDFVARCRGYTALVRSGEAVFSFDGAPVRMRLEGAVAALPETRGLELATTVNYFVGADPERWLTGIPATKGAVYRGAAPGTDWRVTHRNREFDFTLTVPGTDEPRIVFDGWTSLRVADDGTLRVGTERGTARLSAPVAWQTGSSGVHPVTATWVLDGGGRARVALGPRDPSRRTWIDPTVTWQSFIGGSSGPESVTRAAFDPAGALFLAGVTESTDFPVTSGAWDSSKTTSSGRDGFVAKVSSGGTALAWCTYFGSNSGAYVHGLAIDSGGAPVIAGNVSGSSLPVTSGVMAGTPTLAGSNGFVAKLSASGSALTWSSYHPSVSTLLSIGLDPSDRVRCLYANGVSSVAADGSALLWTNQILPSTTVSGQETKLRQLAVGPSGETFVTGSTNQSNLALTSGTLRSTLAGGHDALLVRIASDGSTSWRTLVAGARDDHAYDVACDGLGRPTIVGESSSTDFPVSAAAAQPNRAGTEPNETDGFLARLSSDGVRLRYSTYLGGLGDEHLEFVAVHPGGGAFAAGRTTATGLTLVNPFQAAHAGSYDALLARFDIRGAVTWSSWCGGSASDYVASVAIAGDGSVAAAGETVSASFPTVSPFQSALSGSRDGWFLKIADSLSPDIDPPVLPATPPEGATVGFPCSLQLPVSGGTAPLTWTQTSGSLPPAFSLSAGGVLSGTPAATGTWTFGVRVDDDVLLEGSGSIPFRVNALPTIPLATLAEWTEHTPWTDRLAAANGTKPLAFSISAGSLPAGLTVDPDGTLRGSPSAAGTASFTVRVQDAWGAVATRAMTLRVNPRPAIASSIGDVTTGFDLGGGLSVTGGTAPIVWSLASGTLPVANEIDAATGRIEGISGAVGVYDFTVRATDARGAFAERALRVTVNDRPAITTDSLPFGAAGRLYAATPVAAGGTPPLLWSVDSGTLPEGCVIDASTGRISGTPTGGWTGGLALAVTDASGAYAARPVALDVAERADLTKRKASGKVVLDVGTPSRVTRYAEVLKDTVLDVTVTGGGTKEAGPSIRLVAPDGTPVDPAPVVASGRKGAKLRKWIVPATGRWLVVIEAAPGFRGTMKHSIAITPAARFTGVATVGGDADGVVTFTAPPGARVTATAKPGLGSGAVPGFASLTGPSGADLVPGGVQKRKGSTLTFTTKAPLEGGTHALRIASTGPGAGTVVWTVTLKLPNAFDFDLADVPAGEE